MSFLLRGRKYFVILMKKDVRELLKTDIKYTGMMSILQIKEQSFLLE